MASKKAPGKKIVEVARLLGDSYEIKVIDLEFVIYRNLGNGYDLEISGLDNARKKFHANLYVWDISRSSKIAESILDINSLDELKSRLEYVNSKYLNTDH